MIEPINFIIFSSVLLLIGAYGVIKNKNGIVVLMSIEIMLTAANVNLKKVPVTIKKVMDYYINEK